MCFETAVAHAIVECNSGRMKVAPAAKVFAVRRSTSSKVAEYKGNNSRSPVTYKRVSALGFENEKLSNTS
jgi:hypothetical protein